MNRDQIRFVTIIFVWLVLCRSGLGTGRQVAGMQIGIWPIKNSPYVVVDDIIIPKGLVLKIEPGVIVKFAGHYQIIVEGALIAKGSEARPIVFTSVHDSPQSDTSLQPTRSARPSDWQGIEFRHGCDDYLTALDHCTIRFSDWGIRCVDCFPQLTNIILERNEQMTVTINHEAVPYLPGHGISPLPAQTRPKIAPLPDPQSDANDGVIKKPVGSRKL